jgi:restriction system protein
MPVPDYQSLMLPVLKALADGTETPISEVRERVTAAERLTPDDLREMLASGQPMFTNRVSWAVIYMERAGLVERVRRAIYRLTEEGKKLLAQAPAWVDLDVLRTYPDYVEWSKKAKAPSPRKDAKPAPPDESTDTPEEAFHRAVQQLRDALEAEVLDRVRKAAPAFFEQVVVDLLIAMGHVTGRSGDGGIDGTIKEDTLGLDEVYIQAKKYADGNTVGESDLRNFAGAIDAAGTTKGVFVTTAAFTSAAKDYVKRSPKRIVLIDGEELARLMVEHDIGVRTRIRHAVKRIDEDYFEQEAL